MKEQVQWLVFKRRLIFIGFVMEMVEIWPELSDSCERAQLSLNSCIRHSSSFCHVSSPQCWELLLAPLASLLVLFPRGILLYCHAYHAYLTHINTLQNFHPFRHCSQCYTCIAPDFYRGGVNAQGIRYNDKAPISNALFFDWLFVLPCAY